MKRNKTIDKIKILGLILLLNLTFLRSQTYEYKSDPVGDKKFYYIEKEGLYGVLDSIGNQIIPMAYEDISYKNGYFRVYKSKKYGIIDEYGEIIVPIEHIYIHNIADGKMKYITLKKKVDTIFHKKRKKLWKGDYTIRKTDQFLWDFYDLNTQQSKEIDYARVEEFSEGKLVAYFSASPYSRCFYLDENLERIDTNNYDYCGKFKEGTAVVGDGTFKFVDENFKPLFNQTFENVRNFNEELAAVKRNDLWGYINKKGNVVIDFQYNKAYNFKNGKATVNNKDNEQFTIDKNGNRINNSDSDRTELSTSVTNKYCNNNDNKLNHQCVSKLFYNAISDHLYIDEEIEKNPSLVWKSRVYFKIGKNRKIRGVSIQNASAYYTVQVDKAIRDFYRNSNFTFSPALNKENTPVDALFALPVTFKFQ